VLLQTIAEAKIRRTEIYSPKGLANRPKVGAVRLG